jgi:hypothetical protein
VSCLVLLCTSAARSKSAVGSRKCKRNKKVTERLTRSSQKRKCRILSSKGGYQEHERCIWNGHRTYLPAPAARNRRYTEGVARETRDRTTAVVVPAYSPYIRVPRHRVEILRERCIESFPPGM